MSSDNCVSRISLFFLSISVEFRPRSTGNKSENIVSFNNCFLKHVFRTPPFVEVSWGHMRGNMWI